MLDGSVVGLLDWLGGVEMEGDLGREEEGAAQLGTGDELLGDVIGRGGVLAKEVDLEDGSETGSAWTAGVGLVEATGEIGLETGQEKETSPIREVLRGELGGDVEWTTGLVRMVELMGLVCLKEEKRLGLG